MLSPDDVNDLIGQEVPVFSSDFTEKEEAQAITQARESVERLGKEGAHRYWCNRALASEAKFRASKNPPPPEHKIWALIAEAKEAKRLGLWT